MLYFMPIMSLVIGFTLPSGLTLYWIVNNILSGIQEPLLMIVAKKRYGAVEAEPVKGGKKPKPVIETTGETVEEAEDDEAAETEIESDDETASGDATEDDKEDDDDE